MDGTASRSPFPWESGMPATRSGEKMASTEQVGIVQYDGEVWDTGHRASKPVLFSSSSDSKQVEPPPVPVQSPHPTDAELHTMNARQIKALLREKGLDDRGTKKTLVARLRDVARMAKAEL